MADDTRFVDVLVIGAGPVGLITAYQLVKFGGVSVSIIEKHAKSMQDAYGRAITLFPRSSEMLDQLGLADKLAQQCFACRETVAYNSQGKEVSARGSWNFMQSMKDTAWDFALVLRQKYQEEIFRTSMKEYGLEVEAPIELQAVAVDESVAIGGYRVAATVLDTLRQTKRKIKCKYLVGCDGGRSSVRRLLNISFEGSMTEDRWVRIDGLIKTDLPKPRSYCAIESATHGNVLWAALDRGATRIGYAFTADRAKAYETFDEAAAAKEAIAAVKPFKLEFERVDWWTIYSVGQRVAQNFFIHDCVFLAGDSGHTHSSGAAQGMNTGIHDAVNLAWKLHLVLRGATKPEILHTYQSERLPNIEKLIKYDKDISRLMTNRLPEGWSGDPDTDVNVILGEIMKEAGSFSSGLGIFYDLDPQNFINVEGSFPCGKELSSVRPGKRAPDVTLFKPGTFDQTRLVTETPNVGRFYVVIFAGDPEVTKEMDFFREALASNPLQQLQENGNVRYLTILGTRAASGFEALGHEPLGAVYFDSVDRNAHQRYAIDVRKGAIVVLRPDGWVGTISNLDSTTISELEIYFQRIFVDSV